MNKIFSKLTVRNIKSNFKQFLSVIVIVLLATMLLSGFIVNSVTLDSTINEYFSETKLANLWLYVDGVDASDEAFLSEQGIYYSKRFYAETTADIKAINSQKHTKIFVGDGKISTPIIESGKKGCLIDKNVAENNHIHAGTDTIEFSLMLSSPMGDIPLQIEQRITGTMSFDECADTYSSWPIFFEESVFVDVLNNAITKAGYGTFQLENLDALYNQVLIKTDNVEETSKLIKNYYETAESNLGFVSTRETVESVVLLNSENNQSRKMIYVFPIIFLVVSVLVILTTIDQLVLQEKTKIGTLKSIGISDKRILWHYASYGTVLCAIGSIIGIILGCLIIPNIMFVKYNLVYSIPADYVKIKLPILILLAVFFSMVLIGFLVSLFACFNILHKKPIECLRFDVGFGTKKLKQTSGKLKKLPPSVKMAARNIRLKPIRTLMASIGIAGCVALLLCGIGIGDTLNFSVSNDLDKVFKYDVMTTYTKNDFEENLQQLEEIDFYEKYKIHHADVQFNNNSKGVNVYEIVKNSQLSEIKLSEGELSITKAIADDLGAKVGDEIAITINGEQKYLKITNIIETSFYNGVYVCDDWGFNSLLATNGVWIKCKTFGADFISKLNEINGTNTAYTIEDLRENAENKISSIGIMTNTLEFFAVMLAIVVLLNLIFLVLKERVREIATLKVLGRSIFSIGLSMFFEILFMSVFGTIAGLLLGYPLLILVLKINRVEVFNFIYHINVGSYFVAVAIIFVTIVLVSLLCLIKVKKIDMIESLKSVE